MINNSVYRALAMREDITRLLAPHKVDPSIPAIYENWAHENTERPYICLTFLHDVGDEHLAKDVITTNVDIFTNGDSEQAGEIRKEVIKTLDRQLIPDDEDHVIRMYLTGESIIDEDDPAVCHWNIEFMSIVWRDEFVQYLNSMT